MPATLKTDTQPDKAAKLTPMMEQFLGIKAVAGDEVLLFYRMGDFYELFFEDAVRAAAALDIALTKRGKHEGKDIPMCGVPVHASDTYLPRLIKKGFRVAVCEQTEDPKEAKKRGSKSVVRREIVRFVTPGTLTEDNLLDARGRNIILVLAKSLSGDYALAWADISDGLFQICALPKAQLAGEIASLAPRELLLPEALYQDAEFMNTLALEDTALTPQPAVKFDARAGERRIKERFSIGALDGFGDFSRVEISAAGALLDYLELTQAGAPVQISAPRQTQTSGFLAIDAATRASLEIDRTQKGTRKGSLLSVIDRTVTGAGAREFSSRLNRPLVNLTAIKARHDAVAFFIDQEDLRRELRGHLRACGDMARAVSRIALERGGPRDLRVICDTLAQCEAINGSFAHHPALMLPDNTTWALDMISLSDKPDLASLRADIDKAFTSEVPMQARDGGFVAAGWRPEIDSLKQIRDDSRRIIAGLQAGYAKAADISTLKIKHNNVLGYFIEVTPKYADVMLSMGPESPFIHRQTLVSAVRFTTAELSELDSKITGAADKVLALELAVFAEFARRAGMLTEGIREAARALAILDVQASWAVWASTSKTVRPEMRDDTGFHIEGGRHPVVEQALINAGSAGFTANDCALDASLKTGARLMLITGPNMAGKSTYLRQNALMFILSQAGGYVPARRAVIGIADRLFSRVGASDDLSKGRSTFMTEMIETAAILNQSTPRSFVILDEIGRGTSTFDGLSIAWASAEHLHAVNKCRALFATHYHELTDLIETLDGAQNVSLRAKDWNGELVFLHDVKPGAADKSYGIQVARLAGLPPAAVARAHEVLGRLEEEGMNTKPSMEALPLFSSQLSAQRAAPPAPVSEVETAIRELDIDALSPRAALDLIYELRAKLNPNSNANANANANANPNTSNSGAK